MQALRVLGLIHSYVWLLQFFLELFYFVKFQTYSVGWASLPSSRAAYWPWSLHLRAGPRVALLKLLAEATFARSGARIVAVESG